MIAIIDIGSNSVRLAVFDGDTLQYRAKLNVGLAAGLEKTGELSEDAQNRTLSAVQTLIVKALLYGTERKNIFAFATAAVRRAANGAFFCEKIYAATGIRTEVVGEDEEAMLAINGALGGDDGAVLDIGGGSAELAVRKNGVIIYKKSLPFGAITLYEKFGYDRARLDEFLAQAVTGYKSVPAIEKLTAVGGTATTCAFVMARARSYDYKVTDRKTVNIEDLRILADKFFTFSDDEKEKMGVEAARTKIIASGTELLIAVLEYLGLDRYTASENDNLLGYYKYKRGL